MKRIEDIFKKQIRLLFHTHISLITEVGFSVLEIW